MTSDVLVANLIGLALELREFREHPVREVIADDVLSEWLGKLKVALDEFDQKTPKGLGPDHSHRRINLTQPEALSKYSPELLSGRYNSPET